MLNRLHHVVIGFAACILFASGCNKANTTSVAPAPGSDHQDHVGHDHDGDSDIAKALASLPAEDQEAARMQKTCPVSDEPLGSMGGPIKVNVEGRDVFICCEGCTDVLQGDPATFLAKLPQE